MDITSLHDYLDQDQIWITAAHSEPKRIPIDEMDVLSRMAAARFLVDRAAVLAGISEAQFNESASAGELPLERLIVMLYTPPQRWIRTTRLFQRLTSDIDESHLRVM